MHAAQGVPLLADLLARLGTLLSGPLGGLIGGALSFLLLELGIKKRRERHGIAEALAAELVNNADTIHTFLADETREEIPAFYRTSRVVFDALVSKLGDLRYEDVLSVTKLYGFLEEFNRLPGAWRERALNAYSMHPDHPRRKEEMKALKEGVDAFYDKLAGLKTDCRNLASYLRTKYAIGWRGVLPLRLRPQLPAPSLPAAKPKADA